MALPFGDLLALLVIKQENCADVDPASQMMSKAYALHEDKHPQGNVFPKIVGNFPAVVRIWVSIAVIAPHEVWQRAVSHLRVDIGRDKIMAGVIFTAKLKLKVSLIRRNLSDVTQVASLLTELSFGHVDDDVHLLVRS